MGFVASVAMVVVGAVVFLAFVPVGLLGALAKSTAARWGVLVLGLLLVAVVWLLAAGRHDGQPAVVFGGRRGGSDELADADAPVGGLWLRSMLLHAGMGIVVTWALVTGINLRKRTG